MITREVEFIDQLVTQPTGWYLIQIVEGQVERSQFGKERERRPDIVRQSIVAEEKELQRERERWGMVAWALKETGRIEVEGVGGLERGLGRGFDRGGRVEAFDGALTGIERGGRKHVQHTVSSFAVIFWMKDGLGRRIGW